VLDAGLELGVVGIVRGTGLAAGFTVSPDARFGPVVSARGMITAGIQTPTAILVRVDQRLTFSARWTRRRYLRSAGPALDAEIFESWLMLLRPAAERDPGPRY
jgi:hypothetical protein